MKAFLVIFAVLTMATIGAYGFTVEISTTAVSQDDASAVFRQAAKIMGDNGWSATHSPDRTSDMYLALSCEHVDARWVVVTRSMKPISGRAIGADDLVYLRGSLQAGRLLTPAINRAIEEAAQTPSASAAPRYFTDPTVAIYSGDNLTDTVNVALLGWIHDQGDHLPQSKPSAADAINYHDRAWKIGLAPQWKLLPKQDPWKAQWATQEGLKLAIGESSGTNDSGKKIDVRDFAQDTYQVMSENMTLSPYHEIDAPKGHSDWLIVQASTLSNNGIRTYFMAFNRHGDTLVRLFVWSSQPRTDLDLTVLPAILDSFNWTTPSPTVETSPPHAEDPVLDKLLPDMSAPVPSGLAHSGTRS